MTGLSRRHIIDQVETSLRRLQTDYIDLYYAHDVDPHTRPEQTLAVYDDLIRQGKIRYVGLSNHPAWQVTRALWIADDRRLQAPVATQVKYTSSTAPPSGSLHLPASSSDSRSFPMPPAWRPSRWPGSTRSGRLRRRAIRCAGVQRR